MGLGDRRSALKWQVKNQVTKLDVCCASILAKKKKNQWLGGKMIERKYTQMLTIAILGGWD